MKPSDRGDKNDSSAPDSGEELPHQTDNLKSLKKKVRPDLVISEEKHGALSGNRYIRKRQSHPRYFRKIGPGHFVAEPESDRPSSPFETGYRAFKRVLIGRPLETAEEIHQRLNKVKALAVFGSDAISSSAYATEAALIILMAAGNGALHISFYEAIAITLMLSMVAFSYRQTVHAYPHGGGSYNVSRQNLGVMPGLIAAAALMIDYVLTVSVSIAAGAAAVTSALSASGHSVSPYLNVLLSLIFIALMTFGNLRGIRQSGTIFSIPTYLFVISISAMIIVGLFKAFTGTLHPVSPPPVLQVAQPVTLWLILRSFSAGAVAMSGTEAISNGVPAFQKPESKNAAKTLTWMAALLGVLCRVMKRSSLRWRVLSSARTLSISSSRWRLWASSSSPPIPPSPISRASLPFWRATTTCRTSSLTAATGWHFPPVLSRWAGSQLCSSLYLKAT